MLVSACVTELLVNVLHHPRGGHASAEQPREGGGGASSTLGVAAHQIRGYVPAFAQTVVSGQPFAKCTACSPAVVAAYEADAPGFLRQAFNDPAFLEDLTGLTAMRRAVDDMGDLDWDDGDEDEDGDDNEDEEKDNEGGGKATDPQAAAATDDDNDDF